LPLDNPHILRECFDTFIEKINQIEDPFEQSFFALVHLSYMQAFEDVNKRTARIVANIPLIKKNLRPLSFVDVDQGAYVVSHQASCRLSP
jgi:Fic family protein